MNFPTFIINASGKIVQCSDAARDLLDQNGLTTAASGQPILSRAAARELQTALAAFAPELGGNQRAIALQRQAGEADLPPLWFVVTRLGEGETGVTFEVSVRDLTDLNPFDERRLTQSLGLTQSEASLAVSLALGEAVKDHARRTGRSVATVRWHLSNVLTKTHCRTQAELIRLLLLLSL